MLLKTRSARSRSHFEVASVGLDPALQIIGADPKLSAYAYGLAVPDRPTDPLARYLFCLAWLRVGAGEKIRLMGLRQSVEIGLIAQAAGEDANGYPLSMPVETPTWHFSDATISWHLRRIPVGGGKKIWNARNADGEAYLYSNGPALLFVDPLSDAPHSYKPPSVPGETIVFDLGTFHELRWGMRNDQAWTSFGNDGVLVEGACDIALYASVAQTDPSTRPTLVLPEGVSSDALPPEERFIQNFPSARYTRIGGSILVAEEWDEVQPVQQSLVPTPTQEEQECHLAWKNFVSALPETHND